MKKFLAFLILVLIGIQFIAVERTNPPVKYDFYAPADVKTIIKRACYDCHSNETKWPWYAKVAPMSLLAVSDVNNGRKHLNFTEWEQYSGNLEEIKLKIWQEIKDESMPPLQYRIIRGDGKLTQDEKSIIRNWTGGN
jgi:hypothetical protein